MRSRKAEGLLRACCVALASTYVASVSLAADLTEAQAVEMVRATPEFHAFAQLARRHHLRYDITDTQLLSEAAHAPQSVGVPAWDIPVMSLVIDDKATGDGHWTKWNEFFVRADSHEIFVLDRSHAPFDYPTIQEWRKRRHREKKT